MNVLKSIAQNALLGIGPLGRLATTQHVTGIDGDPRRSRELFEFYRKHGAPTGKDVLELGVGKTLDVLRIARHEGGAKSVAAADVTRYHTDAAAARDGIDYRIYDGRTLPFADASKDLVWACYCIQHFRWPEQSAEEIVRVLRKGGRFVCRADLRDHYHMFDPGQQYDCLKHSPRVWRLMAWNRSSYVNRLRLSEWMYVFANAGLRPVEIVKHQDRELLEQNRHHAYLRTYSDEDLLTYRFDGVYEKP
ncbi:MAG: class I SAM-dependent methyltransferase [Planctomycetota bacterium]